LNVSVLRRYVTTLGTRLRCVGRTYGDEHTATPELFVFQHTPEQAPALIENRLVQARFCRDVATRIFYRPFADLDIFDTCKSSTTTTAWFLLSAVECWCRKSCRKLAIRV